MRHLSLQFHSRELDEFLIQKSITQNNYQILSYNVLNQSSYFKQNQILTLLKIIIYMRAQKINNNGKV